MTDSYVIQLTTGDRLDFNVIFNAYFDALVAFANRYLSSTEESESIVQDAFVALWENRNSFPDQISIKSYLYAIVRNKSLDILKHRKVEIDYAALQLKEQETEFFFMKNMIAEEVRRLILMAIKALPEQSRMVCLLNLDGHNNQEIADTLKISVNTVKFHKKNAYKFLRSKLKNHFYLLFLV